MSAASALRTLIGGDAVVVAPGVYDGLSARLARQASFAAVYATGGGIARSMGYPDLGLLGLTEVVERLAGIVEHAGVPVIADADTGYGNALNTRRAVREFVRAGVAALHLEDQTFPKRCGHLDDKSVVPTAEMVQKLRAARDAANRDELVLIARTDAIGVEGLEAALERAHAYAEAGADVLFVEAPTSEAQIETIARRLPQPKLLNMFEGGKTPLVPLARLHELGYRIVIIPSDLQRAAIHAMQEALAAIKRDGNSRSLAARMASFTEREAIVGTAEYLKLDREDAR
ncbi:MAG TPA: isocitrate lyase/PEP mutase family protein [Methylomirabilota bacterium]|jgi:2-methylisocitrate lyase-like PEP mutase family enzyme|nr:isocitrate lyase/PEP mutase family protein [Methylomirabilota bacterium]